MELAYGAASAAPGDRIVVHVGAGTLRTALDMLSSLHGAGLVAELAVEGAAPSDTKWRIDISSGDAGYVLTDASRHEQAVAGSINDVVGRLKKTAPDPSPPTSRTP
jgi:hypothetical protein